MKYLFEIHCSESNFQIVEYQYFNNKNRQKVCFNTTKI